MDSHFDDPTYPELLVDMGRHLEELLLKRGVKQEDARRISQEAAEFFREHWGGQAPYFGKGHKFETRKRWREIWTAFTGRNHAELARQHKLTVKQVYKIIETMKREELHTRNLHLF